MTVAEASTWKPPFPHPGQRGPMSRAHLVNGRSSAYGSKSGYAEGVRAERIVRRGAGWAKGQSSSEWVASHFPAGAVEADPGVLAPHRSGEGDAVLTGHGAGEPDVLGGLGADVRTQKRLRARCRRGGASCRSDAVGHRRFRRPPPKQGVEEPGQPPYDKQEEHCHCPGDLRALRQAAVAQDHQQAPRTGAHSEAHALADAVEQGKITRSEAKRWLWNAVATDQVLPRVRAGSLPIRAARTSPAAIAAAPGGAYGVAERYLIAGELSEEAAALFVPWPDTDRAEYRRVAEAITPVPS